MLERASTCLESGGRQFFRAPKPALRSRRKLHSTFWHHGASDLSLPLWWAINPATNGAEQPTPSSEAAPLDFLYPEKTLALLRKLSVRSDSTPETRRGQLQRQPIRNYATARRLDSRAETAELEAQEGAVDAAEAKEAKREMHERLMGSSALESLNELVRRQEPGKQELAWQLYNAIPAGSTTDPDLVTSLLEYLTADIEPAIPSNILRLFEKLPDEARTASSFRAAVIARVTLRQLGPAMKLHRLAVLKGRFVENSDHAPDVGTDVLLRRLVADEQWDLAMRAFFEYVTESRFSINRQRTTYRIRWAQQTLPEIWHEAAQLPEIKEHVQSLLVYIRAHKDELMEGAPKKREYTIAFVQSFLANVMDRILTVRKPNEGEIWDWFTKLFEDITALGIPPDAGYDYAINRMMQMDRYRAYTNQRKLHLELYRRYRQWYLYERVEDPRYPWKTLPPQLPMLSGIITTHGKHDSWDRVADVVQDVRTFYPGKPLSVPMLQSLLLIYADHGDVKTVDKYFAEFEKTYGITAKQAQSLIYVQARRADIRGALAAFRRIREDLGITPDLNIWNILLLTYVRADDLDGALETFNNALDAGMAPNVYTFGPMLDMCANRGDIEAFESLYSRAKQMDVPLDRDVRARSGYVQAFLNADDVDAAEDIAKGMLQQWKAGILTGHPLTHTWNIIIQYYALRGDVANSRRLYREMVDNKIPMDNITFGSLMRALVEIKQTNAAYRILRKTLPANNLRVEAIHYAIVMTGFLKERQYDLALEAYERMMERNVNQTISSRQAAINTVGMSELVRLLRAGNTNPRQQLKYVEKLLRGMMTSGDVGQDIAHRQPSHNRYLDTQTQSIVPSSYYGLLITLYNTRGAYAICKELFAKADASTDPEAFDAPTTFLTAIMEAHYRAKEWDEVQKCWELVRQSSSKLVKTFQQVMNPAPSDDGESTSLTDGTVIQRFEESRFALNRRQVIVKATRIYIRSLINRNPKKNPTRELLAKAQHTIRNLLVNGFVIDNFTWNEFIVALAQNGQIVAAFTIAETYLMPRFPGWRNLAPYYIRHNRQGYHWMELRHYDIKRNTVLPRYKTLVVLAKAMAVVKEDERNGVGYVEKEAKWAREILEEQAPNSVMGGDGARPLEARPSILQAFDLPSIRTTSPPAFDRKTLPSISPELVGRELVGRDISRPSSSSSTVASFTHQPLQRQGSNASLQLPALSTLASLASTSPAHDHDSNDHTRRDSPSMKMPSPPSKPSNGLSMTYATAAPATAGGQGNSPPVCQNCTTSTTPLWRRDESGAVLCNACGLFLKLHGRPRPISLKTDVIKSRNRVKTGGPGRKKGEAINGLAAAHPDADGQLALAQHRRASGKISSGLSDRSQSPISRTGTPNFAHPSNIAPQHMFEQALSGDAVFQPSMHGFGIPRQPSPGSTSSINGSHLEPPLSYDSLAAQNTALKTRVSEMELINDLFRNRVSELETSESQARATEQALRAELEATQQREQALKRRIEEIEEESPRHKKMKMSDLVDESRAGSPISSMVE
ncbi:hypothetical protein E8E12_008679 [Didymella heteroderae]|uniref:GATA-type domain-containing protein n=1 Tax=Didymella heteroderae TaxID=1769908 RepID=A0A9P4WUI1_9PLEO|nr:hypothetical protein E8E12_008679 [Didymella heteroderae]